MSLTPEQIKALLAKPVKRARRGKKGPDPSVRDYATWFALKPISGDTRCENSNCVDPRPARLTAMGNEIKYQSLVEINGVKMCRYCFLNGWMLTDPDQTSMAV